MAQHIQVSTATLAQFNAALTQVGEDEVRRALQAAIERKPLGESSLDGKIVAGFEGYGFTEANFRETIVCEDQLLKRHRNGGGWVPVEQDERDLSKAYVAETAYVGPTAIVCGEARVFDTAQVSGSAYIYGSARVHGSAQVAGFAVVYGNASVFGHALVTGQVQVGGNAAVYGHAKVSDKAEAYGNAVLRGEAQISGDAVVHGEADISKGELKSGRRH